MASILLIDDDEDIRKMAAQILRHAGHSVVEACDGRVGLDLFRPGLTELVITDMVMPEKEGFEVLTDLRKRQPSIKIIAMSGGGLRRSPTDNLRMAKHMGAAILRKPFTVAGLIAAVNEVLQEEAPAVQAPAP
jgi:DNA-binding response OmpR family regulator